MHTIATSWLCGEHEVPLESPLLVGILNVTPDSFSDGGEHLRWDVAIQRAIEMKSKGAMIIDVGGESTRPGATRVHADVQLQRVLPVIEGIQEHIDVVISIDTTLSRVAAAAIDAGASIINDVSAGEEDGAMFSLAAETGAGLVLMHRRLPPEHDSYSNEYEQVPESEDVVQEVMDWLLDRAAMAISQGVLKNTIAIDPGLGFGKSVEQNWQIIEQIDRITALGYPVFIGASRKSFIGVSEGIQDPKLRDTASVEAAKEMARKGAQIFRVHNVSEHARMLQSQVHK
jgi:dihydropteroate synthase